jgi:tRNA modification GTPase
MPLSTEPETIVATATPPGRGGIAVVRVSGPLVKSIAEKITGKIPVPRYATFSSFFDSEQKIIDEGLVLFFPGPHSFTGEDVLELQGHGGPIVVDTLIRSILHCGARLARPGEFSERAFLNDKLDLAQAEAIADLIDASSEQAARSALRSLQGEFSQKITSMVEALIRLRIYVEAAIDFAEEEIDFLADQQIVTDLANIINELIQVQSSAVQGSLLRDGITAVIAGFPNVGKSSLINALSGKDVAIVTDIAGTTRDVLRENIIIDGMPVHIIDTAGLRESDDIVELEGIRRAHLELERADFILFVVDAQQKELPDLSLLIKKIPAHAIVITVRNKIDLIETQPELTMINGKAVISLSAKLNLGLDLLKEHIKSVVGFTTTNEGIFSARRRHLDALSRAKIFLLNGQQQLLQHRAGELLAEDLRQAQLALSEITGEFSSDDLLGRIFSSFCIGK